MEEYIFSVIIPIYNEGNEIKKCLDSIVKQEYYDFEIILVDDGSKDCSKNICDEYAKNYSFIKVIHKQNGGSVDARRCGIEIAKGKYIVFIDADDYVEEEYMKSLHKAIEIEADYYILNSKYKTHNQKKLKLQKIDLKEGIIDIKETSKWILCGVDGYIWDKIYVKDIIEKNNIEFSKKITFGDDIYMNLKYLKHVKKTYVQNTSAYVHVWDTPTSVCSTDVSIKRFEELDTVFAEAMDYMEKMNIEDSVYQQFIASNISVIIRTISSLVKSKVPTKDILKSIQRCKIINSIDKYKPQGIKNKTYLMLIKRNNIKLINIIFTFREKIKKYK